MTRFTFGKMLPLPGSSAELLVATIAIPYPTTLANLAREAKISKFAASRAAANLAELDLLRLTEHGYEFNESHPMAADLQALAWRWSGVAREPVTLGRPMAEATPMGGESISHYYRHLPESLRSGGAPMDPDLATAAGPDLVTARDVCTWVDRFTPALLTYVEYGRTIHSLWGTERLRDMVHQTLHFGGALSAARSTLSAASDATVQGDLDPRLVNVNAYAWVRATYLVSAEAWDLIRVIRILNRAIRLGRRVNNHYADALDALETAERVGPNTEAGATWIAEARSNVRAGRGLWDDDSQGPYKNIGGSPKPVDVGTAGDQILAVQLEHDARDLAEQVARMAQHASLEQWADRHPNESPLCTQLPDRLLTT